MAQLQKVGKTATSIKTIGNDTIITYHFTEVVKFNNDDIILKTGGYFTNTTKNRMNQTSNQFNLGFNVYQKNYEWFCSFKDRVFKFDGNSLVLSR
jgi:hypothetical protein